jgi:hypothetical protein
MNEKLLDTLFTRRKEAVTRLAICLSFSAILAVASRIPLLFVSLPATWISGGLSIAFIWVIGPPVLIVLQAYALHGISEAEQLRQLLNSQSSSEAGLSFTTTRQFGEELTPIWRKNFPPIIHLALALVLLAPTIANGILFSSYLSLVRPINGKAVYQTRRMQTIDAMVGIGGWNGFLPIAPSLQDNLRNLENQAEKNEDKLKYQTLAQEIPWAYFPIQSWAYVFLFALSLDSAFVGGAYMTGTTRFAESFLYRVWRKTSTKSGAVWAKLSQVTRVKDRSTTGDQIAQHAGERHE